MKPVVLDAKLDIKQKLVIQNELNAKLRSAVSKKNNYNTCADCSNYPCKVLEEFFNKGRTKYRKQLDFIRNQGYNEFLENADQWKGPSGKLNSQLKQPILPINHDLRHQTYP